MRALVTGGAGFIGSHLVAGLVDAGHEVVVLDNLLHGSKLDREVADAVALIRADVRDAETVLKSARGCDVVFHLAAVLGVDVVAGSPVETMETEVLGIRNVAAAAREAGVEKVVYSSTSGIYGRAALQTAVDEEVLVAPNSSYAIAKRFAEMYLAAQFAQNGLQSVSARYFNVYGPRQDARMVIPRFFEQALRGDPVTVYGSGGQTRDFTYVTDVVDATIKLGVEVSGCEVFNVSTNREYAIGDVAQRVVSVSGSRSEITFVDVPAARYDFEVERRVGCADKLLSAIGRVPSTSLDDGLRRIHASLLS